MPPKRRAPAAAKEEPKARRSALAIEHNITAAQEDEIKEAFELFQEVRGRGKEKQKVIPIDDVRRAMIALDIPPSQDELAEFIDILDAEAEGYAEYIPFLSICALKLNNKESATDASHAREVDEAFALFTNKGREAKISMSTLRRVAKALNLEVEDELLRGMIMEANGSREVGVGVDKEEFDGVMRRAGVWR